MTMPLPVKVSEFDGDLEAFLTDYNYQPKLTARLDRLEGTALTNELVNEIVLWKVNRFVDLDARVLQDLENLKVLKPGEHRRSESVLIELLNVHGVDLPMASTFLRFRNPSVFQIIDRHAYRALYAVDYPTTTVAAKKIKIYFSYLDQLLRLCENRNLDFKTLDRVLYQFDKKKNGNLKGE